MRPALIRSYNVARLMRRIFAASGISKRSWGRDSMVVDMDAALLEWIQYETLGFTATFVMHGFGFCNYAKEICKAATREYARLRYSSPNAAAAVDSTTVLRRQQ